MLFEMATQKQLHDRAEMGGIVSVVCGVDGGLLHPCEGDGFHQLGNYYTYWHGKLRLA